VPQRPRNRDVSDFIETSEQRGERGDHVGGRLHELDEHALAADGASALAFG